MSYLRPNTWCMHGHCTKGRYWYKLNRSSSKMLFLFTLSGWTQHSCVSTSNSVLIPHDCTPSTTTYLWSFKPIQVDGNYLPPSKKWCHYKGNYPRTSHPTLRWWWRRFLKTWWKYRKGMRMVYYLFYVKFFCHSHISWLADSYMFLRLRRKINIFRSTCWIELKQGVYTLTATDSKESTLWQPLTPMD
jgi:hypothetical protein